VAGAGYGKTQAVYSFLQEYHAVKTWLQLSAADNMAETFGDKFIKAVSIHNKVLTSKLVPIGFPESDRQFEQFHAVLDKEMPPNKKHIFVFDDFHWICDELVLQFTEKMSSLQLAHISIILISRVEPKINIISLLAKGVVFQVSEADLRFTKEEMLAYFKMLDIVLAPQAAMDMYAVTDGWAFAIHLLSLSLKNGVPQENQALTAMKTNIFRLIEAEIFSVSSRELQKFLIGLSLINCWPPNLLAELSESERLIDEIREISSFIQYDAYTDEYRIHHLFLEYLSQKQDLLSDEEKQTVYRKAAQWCAKNDYKMDAIIYYEKVGDYKGISEVAYTMAQMTPSRVAMFLLDVLSRIPEQAFRENVELYIIQSKMLQTITRFEDADAVIRKTIKTFEALPATPINCWLLSECYLNLGYIGLYTALHTNICDYSDLFEKGYQYFQRSGHMVMGPKERALVSAYITRTGCPAAKGELEKGNIAFSRYVTYAIEAKSGIMNGMVELANCEVAYYKADLKKAEGMAYQSIRKAKESEQFQIENRALLFLLRINIHKGSVERIRDILHQLQSQLEQEEFLHSYTLYDIAVGWFYAQIRQTDRIAGWLKNSFNKSDLNPLMFGLENLVRAKSFFAEKRYHAALNSLEGQDSQYGPEAFLLGKLELTALRAVCKYHIGEKKEAIRVLQEAYAISLSNELDMPFIELGKDMRTLAVAAMKEKGCVIPQSWLEKIHKKASTYAKNLSYVISEYRIFHHINTDVYTLTNREKEILADLCRGLSRTEIACNCNISLSTVKTLIQSIYTKLGTQNIAEAIWIAATFKLIE
jgi:LuxR family maltose regulon positive regulatory protein